MTDDTHSPANAPLRREQPDRTPFVSKLLLAATLGSGAMLALGVPNLLSGDGAVVWLKAGLLATSATVVAYGVNRLAVERGAPLANAGYLSAGVLSVASILGVGAGMFLSTFAGLTLPEVERLRLEAQAEALSTYVAEAGAASAQSATVASGIQAAASDLGAKLACEIATSCLSGRGKGGHGPVARALEGPVGKARAMAAEVSEGVATRQAVVADLHVLLGRFHAVLGDADLSSDERRLQLTGIDAAIKARVGDLEAALPLQLIAAYAGELREGLTIPSRPETAAAVSVAMRGHGEGLAAWLAALSAATPAAPAFPGKSGVGDSLGYITHFAPVAVIAAVCELVLPLAIWVYTLLALNWATYRLAPTAPRRPHQSDLAIGRLLPGPEDYAPPEAPPPAPARRETKPPKAAATAAAAANSPTQKPRPKPARKSGPGGGN